MIYKIRGNEVIATYSNANEISGTRHINDYLCRHGIYRIRGGDLPGITYVDLDVLDINHGDIEFQEIVNKFLKKERLKEFLK